MLHISDGFNTVVAAICGIPPLYWYTITWALRVVVKNLDLINIDLIIQDLIFLDLIILDLILLALGP